MSDNTSVRRSKRDLSYLVETTQPDGTINASETALYGDREERLVALGWKDEKYGTTLTELGKQLAVGLRQIADASLRYEVQDYPERVEKLADRNGVTETVSDALEAADGEM